FVTLFLGILQHDTGELRYCNAGHLWPYHIVGQRIAALGGVLCRPLGVQPTATYKTEWLRVVPGDVVYLYSDGITEASNRAGELFTETRLEPLLREAGGSPAAKLVKTVAAAVRDFAEGTPQADDITAMAIRLRDPALL